jgi:histidinol-phosphate aminotransferase
MPDMTKEIKKIRVPESIETLVPYPPGKPIEELERELGITGSIKLASNENPLGPSKKAITAVSGALKNLNRYPDGSCYYLKERLSSVLGITPDMLIIGNGSNEIIELLMRTCLSPGMEVIMAEPSFAVYPLATMASQCVPRSVALTTDLRHDLKAMADLINDKTRLIFIANPNNPTGTIVSEAELKEFMERVPEDVVVCVDEAYFEFVEAREFPDSLRYVSQGRAVLVLRTFSKIYGLAGLRVGYGVSRPDIIGYMNRVRQPFNVNSLAQVAALAALDDAEHLRATKENNREGLSHLFNALKKEGFECVPTHANFFLVKVGDGRAVYEALLKKGVIVRPMASYGLPQYIRVTVGLPEENKRFLDSFVELGRY